MFYGSLVTDDFSMVKCCEPSACADSFSCEQYMMKSCESLKGGLSKIAQTLEVCLMPPSDCSVETVASKIKDMFVTGCESIWNRKGEIDSRVIWCNQ